MRAASSRRQSRALALHGERRSLDGAGEGWFRGVTKMPARAQGITLYVCILAAFRAANENQFFCHNLFCSHACMCVQRVHMPLLMTAQKARGKLYVFCDDAIDIPEESWMRCREGEERPAYSTIQAFVRRTGLRVSVLQRANRLINLQWSSLHP